MTSSNINKIVRSNITLKPWILSKNTSEIVNTCIQKIYKQSQNNFKNDPTKVATSKPENKGPIRAFKSQERVRIPLSINVSRAKKGAPGAVNAAMAGNSGAGAGGSGGASGAVGATATATAGGGVAGGERLASNAAANNRRSAVASLAANRRLLKSSPNYKIYSSRRFGSSASSSNASIFRRSDERRRSTTQTAQLNYLLRTFATHMNSNKPYGADTILPKFMISARNQHMESRTVENMPPHAAQMTSAIQSDLMPIDSTIRDRIALGRPRLTKVAQAQKAKTHDPMNGWHHPPSQEVFLSRVSQRGIANTELQEQYRRMKNANRMRQFEHILQMEKRNSILGALHKKPMVRVIDGFEGSPRDTPRVSAARNQTPNFENTYKTLLARQAVATGELDPAVAPTLPPINISHITSVATPSNASQTAKPMVPTSVPLSYGNSGGSGGSGGSGSSMQSAQQNKRTNEAVSNESAASQPATLNTTTAAYTSPPSGSATTKAVALPAPKQSNAESTTPPTPMLTISKKSATSQVVSRALAAQNQMRFNHSTHLKKF